MDILGINEQYLIIQLVICVIWPMLVLLGLITLRRVQSTDINKTLWTFIIIAIPILGAMAFFILNPGKNIHS